MPVSHWCTGMAYGMTFWCRAMPCVSGGLRGPPPRPPQLVAMVFIATRPAALPVAPPLFADGDLSRHFFHCCDQGRSPASPSRQQGLPSSGKFLMPEGPLSPGWVQLTSIFFLQSADPQQESSEIKLSSWLFFLDTQCITHITL